MFGLWDQLRVDHGTEWYLMLSVNRTLSHLRNRTDREPQVQTTSKLVRNGSWLYALKGFH